MRWGILKVIVWNMRDVNIEQNQRLSFPLHLSEPWSTSETTVHTSTITRRSAAPSDKSIPAFGAWHDTAVKSYCHSEVSYLRITGKLANRTSDVWRAVKKVPAVRTFLQPDNPTPTLVVLTWRFVAVPSLSRASRVRIIIVRIVFLINAAFNALALFAVPSTMHLEAKPFSLNGPNGSQPLTQVI